MEDHIRKDAKKVEKRVEQLNFDRVYAIQEGSYDAFVMDHRDAVAEGKLESGTRRTVNMHQNKHYVVLRTGDGESFPQSLVVFPEEQSGSSPFARTWLAIFIAV